MIREYKHRWVLSDGSIALHCLGPPDLGFIMQAWSEVSSGFDLWNFYCRPVIAESQAYVVPMFPFGEMTAFYVGQGRDFFSPKLMSAYTAARSARFEHGENPGKRRI